MIVHDGPSSAVLFGPGEERAAVRCLARRGMLHSECEAFDEVELAPGTRWEPAGRAGTETVWYVLTGTVHADRRPVPLTAGGLVLAPHGGATTLTAGRHGARLLCLTLGPASVTRALPARTPSTARDALDSRTPGESRNSHNSRKDQP
ncbi:pirin family protein [Streptomyces niveiscabiei]|uniref:Cupin domain-containing protein n=1 Tax=Streptomyces niveiscabiei TaxID=164115 RepID=A0ABW9I3V0_9ACTN